MIQLFCLEPPGINGGVETTPSRLRSTTGGLDAFPQGGDGEKVEPLVGVATGCIHSLVQLVTPHQLKGES